VVSLVPVSALFLVYCDFDDGFLGCRKSRRKDKETPMVTQDEESRQYLEEDFVNEQICDADFSTLVELPHGLDYNEWLATHSE
jgi:hypothetical protein